MYEVFLQDVNESPTSLTLSGGYTDMTIPRKAHPGVAVETFSVADEDQNDSHTFQIIGGTADSYFEISGNHLILAKQLPLRSNNFLLDVVATDSEGLTAMRHFVISVIDNSTCINVNNPCHENAICFMLHRDKVSCICELGYSGDGYSCVDIDYCESNPCNLDNTIGGCIDEEGGIDSFICNCKPGFTSPDCSIEVDECAAIPCDPVGSSGCVDLLDDFSCSCQKGYTGKLCEVNINNCESHLCVNNGSCVDQVDGFTCLCAEPYWGEYCENSDTVCDASHFCPHGGECDAATNTCHCTVPYTDNCQHCIEGCHVDKLAGNCVDYDECANDPHPCGKNSTLTCVNLKSMPCSYCCLDKNGDIQFCGPKEVYNPQKLEAKNSNDAPVTAIVVPVAVVGIVIVILAIFGKIYFRHRCGSKKYKFDESSDHTNAISFNNPTYSSPLHSIEKGAFNLMPSPQNGSSAVTTAMCSNDEKDPGN